MKIITPLVFALLVFASLSGYASGALVESNSQSSDYTADNYNNMPFNDLPGLRLVGHDTTIIDEIVITSTNSQPWHWESDLTPGSPCDVTVFSASGTVATGTLTYTSSVVTLSNLSGDWDISKVDGDEGIGFYATSHPTYNLDRDTYAGVQNWHNYVSGSGALCSWNGRYFGDIELEIYDNAPDIECVLETDKTSGMYPLTVTFTDNSTGFPESAPYDEYEITFGDGGGWSGEWQYPGEFWFHTYYNAGTYTVTYTITDDGTEYNDTETITVSATSANYYVQVHGTNTAPISGANVSIWYDGAYQESEGSGEDGRAYFNVSSGRYVYGTVTKSGYHESTFSQFINTWDTWTSVTLYTDAEPEPGEGEYETYGNLIITVRDLKSSALIDDRTVFVYIYSDSGRENLFLSDYTTSGVYAALVPTNTTYYYTLTASTYNDKTFSSEITTSPTYMTQYMTKINYASDIDGDGIPDWNDDDIDGDGIPNDGDTDDDGDGISDNEDETPDGGTEQMLLPNLRIWVYSTTGTPIDGAIINVVSSGDSSSHITNSTGYAIHYCSALVNGTSRVYTVSVSKAGYVDQTGIVTVSTQAPTITFYMVSYTGQTASPTPTAVYTPVVLPTWSGTNGTPGTYKEQFLNFTMSQFGVGQFEAGVLIGLVLTLLSAVFVGGCLAGYGAGGNSAGIGAMIGGAFGWVASGMLGFIPLWALIVTVALVAMIFFIFLRGGGSGGG